MPGPGDHILMGSARARALVWSLYRIAPGFAIKG